MKEGRRRPPTFGHYYPVSFQRPVTTVYVADASPALMGLVLTAREGAGQGPKVKSKRLHATLDNSGRKHGRTKSKLGSAYGRTDKH